MRRIFTKPRPTLGAIPAPAVTLTRELRPPSRGPIHCVSSHGTTLLSPPHQGRPLGMWHKILENQTRSRPTRVSPGRRGSEYPPCPQLSRERAESPIWHTEPFTTGARVAPSERLPMCPLAINAPLS